MICSNTRLGELVNVIVSNTHDASVSVRFVLEFFDFLLHRLLLDLKEF